MLHLQNLHYNPLIILPCSRDEEEKKILRTEEDSQIYGEGEREREGIQF